MPFPPRQILVVDDNSDNGALLVRTLVRKFPQAHVQLCADSATAVRVVSPREIDVAIVHRSTEEDAVRLVGTMLKASPALPIIVVSGIDRSEAVLRAGAAGFMKYDEWLRIGTFVTNVMQGDAADQGHAPLRIEIETDNGIPQPLRLPVARRGAPADRIESDLPA